MSDNNNVHRLVIQNLKMIDETQNILDEVQITVFNQIDEYFERWAKNKGWLYEGNFWKSVVKFYPSKWDCSLAYFSLDLEADCEDDNISWLSYLCATNRIRLGIYWQFLFSNDNCKYSLAQWKKELKNQYQEESNHFKFTENKTEIVYKDRGLFIPIKIDAKLLSDNYPDNLDIALEEPIYEALKHLDNVFPIIDKIYHQSIR